MTEFFLNIVNMSISASWLVFAVLLLRLSLKKAPKWINVLLWGIVAVRLICPFSFESVLSLIPSSQTINPEIALNAPVIDSGVTIIDNVINPIIGEATISLQLEKDVNLFQFIMPYLAGVWLVGIAALLIYTLISFLRLKRKIGTAVLLRDNIYQSEAVVSPFVLGIIKPKIYLPFNMNGQDMEHVIAHERAHIRRKDHLWKPLGFLILTLHWFNPVVWLGYILLCRDIELACDEKVVKELNNEQRADYSEALLACSVNRRMIAACPLAFGEVGVKDRIKSVLNYKKPAFWIIIVAVIASIVTAICFLTNPLNKGFSIEPKSDFDIYEIEKHYYDKVVGADIANESDGYYDIAITKDMFLYKYFKAQGGTIDNSWIDIGKLVKQEDTTVIEALIKDNIPVKYKFFGIKEFYVALDESEIQSASCVIIMNNGDILFANIPAYTTENRYVSNLMKLKIKNSEIQNGTYKLSKEIYFNGAYSYVPDLENDKFEIKTNGGMHIYHFTGEVLSTGARYEEVKLNKSNFSDLFDNMEIWSADINLKDLLKNNKKVWCHNTPDDIGGYPYMLLLQKDGTLCMIFADFENGAPTSVRYIYELEYEGNIENSYNSTVGGSEKLAWIYNPLLSYTVHYTIAFAFDCEYTYVDATCTGGAFCNLEAEGQPHGNNIRFEKEKKIYWTPAEDDENPTDKSEVTFTVYNGDTKMQQHTVIFECVSRNYSTGDVYEFYLKDAMEFALVSSEYGYLTFVERSSISNVSGADEPSNVIVNTTINGLKVKYPQFFNVSTDGGLTVYIWQMSKDNYSCYLANTSMEAISDNSFAYETGATIPEMRTILTTYDISKENISIHPVRNPLSSYYYTIDDKYRETIKNLFWAHIIEVEPTTEEESTVQSESFPPKGSFENPYNVGDSARIKHSDIHQKDVVYDYNASITRILTGTEAEEKLKEIASNYEEEKEALEIFDLYLARVHIKYNEESTVKDRLPTDLGVTAVRFDKQLQFIDPRFYIPDNVFKAADGEFYFWAPVLAEKNVSTRWLSITVGTYQGAPGIISGVCFNIPPEEKPVENTVEFSGFSYIYRCDDAYRIETLGNGTIHLPEFPDSIKLQAYGIVFCDDGCNAEGIINRAIQGWGRVYHIESDSELEGNHKILKFKMTVPEQMIETLKERPGQYEDILAGLERNYYYLIPLDETHYGYFHFEGDNEELADSIIKSSQIVINLLTEEQL